MARMHSGAKGKSGSKKPIKKTQPSWVRYTPKEIELLIAKFAKEGRTASQIGLYLRDTYGIPDVRNITHKKITQILQEKNMGPELPDDLRALIRKATAIRRHLEGNKLDQPARLGLTLTESKIKRLIRYYKESNKLALDWKYDPKRATTYLE
ncbi:30S ribosomal protein S15 [Candidatus Woesearchaeota archaeon]|nr:30S ribosomal protein S15 [Candidatus Woesearchaeota archaeon]